MIPITGLSNSFDFILLIVAWLVVGERMKKLVLQATDTIKYIHNYFLYFAIFNLFMALPCVLVVTQPVLFPVAMGWGYTVANVFLLISLSYLSRMEVKIVPQWAAYERLMRYIWVALNVIMTTLNVMFVALNNQPTFDSNTGVTHFQFPAFLGPILGVISLAAYLPGVVLFIISAVHQTGDKRVRSVLLAAGMAIIMVVGPLHAAATSWQIFLLADILNIISLALLASGVIYGLRALPTTVATPPKVTA